MHTHNHTEKTVHSVFYIHCMQQVQPIHQSTVLCNRFSPLSPPDSDSREHRDRQAGRGREETEEGRRRGKQAGRLAGRQGGRHIGRISIAHFSRPLSSPPSHNSLEEKDRGPSTLTSNRFEKEARREDRRSMQLRTSHRKEFGLFMEKNSSPGPQDRVDYIFTTGHPFPLRQSPFFVLLVTI